MSDEEKKDVQPEETAEATTETPEAPAKEEKPAEETPAEAPAEEAKDAPAEDASEAPAEEAAEDATEPEEEPVVEEIPHQNIKPGMIVRVHEKIKDVNARGEEKTRVQIFEGLVIGMRGAGVARMMTVRKDSKGFMVEKIYPLSSPNIETIEVVKQYRARRAKLTYLRGNFKRKLKEVATDK